MARAVPRRVQSIFWPLPVRSRAKRSRRCVGHLDAGGIVRDGGVDVGGDAVLDFAFAGHEARHRLDDDVVAAALCKRAAAAEGGVLAVDEARVELAERGVVDAEAFGDAGAVVDDDDIDGGEELVDHLASLGARQVDGDALLTAVEAYEGADSLGTSSTKTRGLAFEGSA
jgi:hypothetical protein